MPLALLALLLFTGHPTATSGMQAECRRSADAVSAAPATVLADASGGASRLMARDSPADQPHGVPRHVPLSLLGDSPFAVTGPLPPPPDDVVDLKFAEFFVTPVGPRGLVPTQRLRALNGRQVRLVGFMAQQEAPTVGLLLLTPRPVPIAEVEDGMADDLPPQVVFVHVQGAEGPLSYLSGLLQFTGTLQVGAHEESDGRVSLVRLVLDPSISAALVSLDRAADAQRH